VTLGTPLRPSAGVTRATYTVEVEISDVIDLRERSVRDHLGTNLAELCAPWRYRKDRSKPPTQRLGKAVAQGGFSGLLYRSTKGAGACLVVFTDNLKRSGSWLEVQDGSRTLERLP
jgi:RES domain